MISISARWKCWASEMRRYKERYVCLSTFLWPTSHLVAGALQPVRDSFKICESGHSGSVASLSPRIGITHPLKNLGKTSSHSYVGHHGDLPKPPQDDRLVRSKMNLSHLIFTAWTKGTPRSNEVEIWQDPEDICDLRVR